MGGSYAEAWEAAETEAGEIVEALLPAGSSGSGRP